MTELSEDAHQLALALHQAYDGVGVGPSSAQQMLGLTDLEPEMLVAAIDELEALGFVKVVRGIPAPNDTVPKVLWKIGGLTVREALHEYVEAG